MIRVLSFSPPHTAGVAALIVPIQQAEFGIPITLEAQPDLSDIGGFYQRGNGGFWVALDAGRVVGSIGLLDIGNAQGALRKMFVAATHRGREAGVARQLLDTLLDHARQRQLSGVYLGTTDKFLAAHRFYEKNGFRQLARESLPERFPVMSVDTRFYFRAIPSDGA